MPKSVEDCVKHLTKKGYKKDEAWAICQSAYKKSKDKKKDKKANQ